MERNSLATIHESALKAKAAYDQCISDAETATLVRQLKELRKRGKENRKLQMDLRSELERASENERQAEEQIRSLLRELQALARKLTGTEVTLEP